MMISQLNSHGDYSQLFNIVNSNILPIVASCRNWELGLVFGTPCTKKLSQPGQIKSSIQRRKPKSAKHFCYYGIGKYGANLIDLGLYIYIYYV